MHADSSPAYAAAHDAPHWQSLLALPPAARPGVHIHLVGIGGSGLSAIAVLLLEMGFKVSGSDRAANEATDDVSRRGATIYIGHASGHVAGADLVLISSAVPDDNPEVQAAQAGGIPIVKRADFLGPLMAPHYGVGIAGTHGKTTTTAMLALILWRAGRDPSFIVGARLAETGLLGSAARAGRGPFVIEADEYDRMFLGLRLRTAIVTNVEWDHVDCYPTPEAFTAAFRQLVSQLPSGGHLVLCADNPGALDLRTGASPNISVETYGLLPANQPDWLAGDPALNAAGGFDAGVVYRREQVARLSLAVPGRHNLSNALAAMAAAHHLGVAPAEAAAILQQFRGAARRFEVIGEAGGVTVVDDYGHHPTEIAATLAAARARFGTRRIWAVFQPHTYTRFEALLQAFARSFSDADRVIVLDIYAARERDDMGIHSRRLLEHLDHPAAEYIGSIEAAAGRLAQAVAPGDVVVTLSAGSGNQVGQLLLERLQVQATSSTAAGDGERTAPAAPAPLRPGQSHAAFILAAAKLQVAVVQDEPLARHTTFRIGGPAELFATVNDTGRLSELASLAADHGLPVTVLGGGSNLLVSDAGVAGLVIANAARHIGVLETEAPAGVAPQVAADSGVPLAGLARWAIRQGWAGLEWAVSVPGTVGGAVIGNAGAHGGQIADNLAWVEVTMPDGRREFLKPADLRFAYRSSVLKEALALGSPVPPVLAAGFQLGRGDPEELARRAKQYLARRRATQPVEPSAGSIFRNPPGDFAGRLIQAAGLQERQIGGAQVSSRHANFIVNAGNARAADVRALIDLIQARVLEEFGVRLVPEILFLGDW